MSYLNPKLQMFILISNELITITVKLFHFVKIQNLFEFLTFYKMKELVMAMNKKSKAMLYF